MRKWWLSGVCVLWLGPVCAAADQEDPVDYVQDVKPILARRCYACHGALKQKNDLRLDTAALAIKGGSGGPAVAPGRSGESLILDAVKGENGVRRMPPEGEPLKPEEIATLRRWIDAGAKAPVEKTPEDPARHWSYQSVVRPEVPVVAHRGWVQNPIDAFVAAEHEKRTLQPAPEAPAHLLLRRVYLDLVGLPPTRAELAAFLADSSPGAYERVVDRLLDSPHYGERWGRHWMDVWRYSDWDGAGAEVRESQPHIWRWRDWIVESLNADKPYDEMIVEMLAGDELAPSDAETIRATGFLVRNWFKFNRNVWIDNTVEHTSKAFLAATLNCARCHDHMYDPIAQRDYYQFRAFFEPHGVRTDALPGQLDPRKAGLARVFDENAATPTYLFTRGDEKRPDTEHPLTAGVPASLSKTNLDVAGITFDPEVYYPGLRSWMQRDLLADASAAVDSAFSKWTESNSTLAAARKKLAQVAATAKSEPAVANPAATEPAATDQATPEKPKENTSETAEPSTDSALKKEIAEAEQAAELADKTLASARAALVWTQARIAADKANYTVPPADNAKDLSLAAGRAEREHTLRLAELNILQSEKKLTAAKGMRRRDAEAMKKAVADAEAAITKGKKERDEAQAALAEPLENYTRFTPVYPAGSSGRRLALARWIAHRDNPRTARVAINHMWLRHFGSPLVPTMFDFGLNGKPPTHPALLDWLASELMQPADGKSGSWQMKHIHRLIVTSNAYRQQSAVSSAQAEANRKLDPDNLYLWRMNVHRMEAEIVRDGTLYVAGELDPTLGGAEIDENAGMTNRRRSIYFRNSKEKKMTFLDLFDRANVVECYRRPESIVPQQALAMANSPLSLAQARVLAGKLSAECGAAATPENIAAFIATAFQQILNRPPTAEEQRECETFLDEQSRQFANVAELTQFVAGKAGAVAPAADPHQRARENLVHVLFNHNDFLTVR